MQPDMSQRHYLRPSLGDRAINVMLVGCGGNGAQMLMGLASLDTALRAISSRSRSDGFSVVGSSMIAHSLP